MNGTTNFISRGADVAYSRGMVVTSAGNEGSSSEPHIGAPADAVSVITIGAVDPMETRTSFSSIGPSSIIELSQMLWRRINGCFIRRIRKYSYGKWDFIFKPNYGGMVACYGKHSQ
jgi:hypothetical protein